MASKSMILSYFVTKQLLTEHILYDLPINGKYIKFGARFRFDTLNKNNHHSYYIFRSGGTICNPRWPTKKTGIQYNFELSAKNEFRKLNNSFTAVAVVQPCYQTWMTCHKHKT